MKQKTGITVFASLAILVILIVTMVDVPMANKFRPVLTPLQAQASAETARPAQIRAAATLTSLPSSDTHRRYLLVHYLPWYEADAAKNNWGWHWTMNHYRPADIVDGRRSIASQYYPLIGPYDSDDPDVIEYHVLLMKFAGIDGAVVDWYGTDNYLDYGLNHRNARQFVGSIEKAHLHFAALYEDEVAATRLVKDGQLPASQAVAHGQSTMEWLQNNWFGSPSYIKLDGKPLFLTFGTNGYYKTDDWNQIFSVLPQQPAYFSESFPRAPATGAFCWPAPFGGTDKSMQDLDTFYANSSKWPAFIAGAYPRFHDIYKQAGVGPSWGTIDDLNGQTYSQTLTKALQSSAPVIQIATWNDWGEGTMIEPSVEYGYRDLETTQKLVKKYLNPAFSYTPSDLQLPLQLYKLRKSPSLAASDRVKLDAISTLLFEGKTDKARKALASIKNQ